MKTASQTAASLFSQRLELRVMTPEFMHASISGDLSLAQQLLGAELPVVWPDNRVLLELRLCQLKANPELQPWLLRAICLSETNAMIGYIGFHTRPNPHYLQRWLHDAVEFGFEIFPAFRRKGYATEAAQALMHWSSTTHGVNRFVLTIVPDNQASQALAAGLGFKRIGSHMDAVDGLEDVLTLEYSVANPSPRGD
jgi:RimJ/RimL family protein N-acetyltransferase